MKKGCSFPTAGVEQSEEPVGNNVVEINKEAPVGKDKGKGREAPEKPLEKDEGKPSVKARVSIVKFLRLPNRP
jgi:hypothetical protein